MAYFRYLALVFVRFKKLLGGGSLSVIVLAAYEHYAGMSASWQLYLWIMAACLMIALFLQGAEYYKGLQPRIKIGTNPLRQQVFKGVLYYFDVENSGSETLEHVSVRLKHISPEVKDMNWLPVPLHIKHDNKEPHSTEFSLNPKEKKQIDIVEMTNIASGVIQVKHIVQDISQAIPIGRYVLTIEATAKNVLPAEARFQIWINDGELRCVAL
jgi:hypothetical protein